jgi:hypothetical protein
MPRTLLLIVLVIAIGLELALAGGAFFAPAFTLAKFGVKYESNTQFLAYLTGWFLLFVSLVALLAWARVRQRRPGYAGVCYLLGWWWVGIGVGIYIQFGRLDNLLLDSLKGLLIIVLTWQCQARSLVVRR